MHQRLAQLGGIIAPLAGLRGAASRTPLSLGGQPFETFHAEKSHSAPNSRSAPIALINEPYKNAASAETLVHSSPTTMLDTRSPTPLTPARIPKPVPRTSAGSKSVAVADSRVSSAAITIPSSTNSATSGAKRRGPSAKPTVATVSRAYAVA